MSAGPQVPDKPSLDGIEQRWDARWEADGTYRFDRTKPRDEIYSVDTPPPTVSGSLHVGSAFGYIQTDTLVRYHRMRGDEVFYPMGWDDNGLPTERRVQNYYGVRCDPGLPYDPEFEPPVKAPKEPLAISRKNFVELCHVLTAEDEQVFEEVWRRLGLSVDWTLTYATIDDHSQKVSQAAFLHNLARGEAYQAEAPTLWDIDFRTAVAQAELEDRERPGTYHRVRFETEAGEPIPIETTRPELIPACVALVAHPDDQRYQPLFGSTVVTPLFGVRVPVHPHGLADPEKGSGIAMICTFGDTTDVTWWRELDLPTRAVVQHDGRIRSIDWGSDGWESTDPERAQRRYDELAGKTVKQAQKRIVELLAESGHLEGEPRRITHPVKFYEKGDRPLEIVTSRQWYIRNGGRDEDLREALVHRGGELEWHPHYMRARYEDWVRGLSGDWLISRQRFFGVPIPLWYPVRDDGEVDHGHPIVPDEDTLPIDPSSDVPPGFDESHRGGPGGFVGDPDIMDTWATSSLTPQIATGWLTDPDLFERTFPTDMRPQGHDIIRTWLFATLLRSHFEHGELPWRHASINGWILDPDRKKMSKSKGNVITPLGLVEQHSADAVRYWAATARPGTDTAFDEGQMKVGRRLAIKILNASRFVLSRLDGEAGGEVTNPLDRSMLGVLAELVDDCTRAFDGYDYARALERTEQLFWGFCDDYLELVKGRAYGAHGPAERASANASLAIALNVLLRLFAPHLPFVTEEVWSWWQDGSVHRAPWPDAAELRERAGAAADAEIYATAASVLGEIRKAKTEAKKSLKADVAQVEVVDTPDRIVALRQAEQDLKEAGNVAELVTREGPEPAVGVTLADPA